MRNRRPSLQDNQQGSLLIGLIVALSILAVAGAGLVGLLTSSTYTGYAANRHIAAYYMAESGGRYAIPQIINDVGRAIEDLDGNTYPLGNGQEFTLTIDNSSDDYVYLTSTGRVSHNSVDGEVFDWAEARATINYRFLKQSAKYDRGVFGTTGVSVHSSSSVGELGVSPAMSDLDVVGTNGDAVVVASNSYIYGGTVTNEGKTLSAEEPPTVFDPLEFMGQTYGDNDILDFTPSDNNGNGNCSISGGTYQLKSFSVHNNSTLTVSGDVVLYVEDFSIYQGTTVTLNEGASLTVYFSDTATLKMNSQINYNGDTANVALYGTETATNVDIYKNSRLNGVVYAPTTDINIYKGTIVTGSVVGDFAEIQDNSQVLYDPLLDDSGSSGGGVASDGLVQYFSN